VILMLFVVDTPTVQYHIYHRYFVRGVVIVRQRKIRVNVITS
jgi:hypothetical protein